MPFLYKKLAQKKNAFGTPRQSDHQLQKSYCFSFLALEDKFREQELEQRLTDHIQKLLLELGHGFTFVSRQYPQEVGGKKNLSIFSFTTSRYIPCCSRAKNS